MNKKMLVALVGTLGLGVAAPAARADDSAKAEKKPDKKGGKKGAEKSCSGDKKGSDKSCGAKSCGGKK